jgi:hypothetical protein
MYYCGMIFVFICAGVCDFTDRLCGLVVRVSGYRFPALPDFLSSSGSGTGSTQPREPREVN